MPILPSLALTLLQRLSKKRKMCLPLMQRDLRLVHPSRGSSLDKKVDILQCSSAHHIPIPVCRTHQGRVSFLECPLLVSMVEINIADRTSALLPDPLPSVGRDRLIMVVCEDLPTKTRVIFLLESHQGIPMCIVGQTWTHLERAVIRE